jgi:DNA helicase-2/ATP-dependent DNA helicase PcrA
MMDLLAELNDNQREAVEYIDGPQLVIAGAGSGKTRVLTYKIAYLLQQGYFPWSILALTFTNKAANEMKERIGSLVGNDSTRKLQMGTFHSIFSRILRKEAQSIGYDQNFTIYDESDSRSLIKAIIKEMGLDDKVYKPSTVHAHISMAKNQLMNASDYQKDHSLYEYDYKSKIPATGKIFAEYSRRCRAANAMDFDDLLTNTFELFATNEEIRLKYVDRFRYILVDEYQDTNYAQHQILLLLTRENRHICVVGDDAQSIYGFRGANIDNILKFTKIYDNAKLFKLERNYRSTQRIVEAANSLIKHNRGQIPKDVFSENAEGDKILLRPAYSDREEASIVAKELERIKHKDKCQWGDFAILYRTNAQSRTFEEEFMKSGIPYRIHGGQSFYQRKEIKDIIAYFRLVVNPNDEEAIKRVINYPARGIGNTTLEKIAQAAHSHSTSFWNVIGAPEIYGLNVNKGTLNKLNLFKSLIDSFIALNETLDAFQLGSRIIKESGLYEEIFKSKDPDDLDRQDNVDEFLSSMQEFVDNRKEEDMLNEISLNDYLQDVSLMSDLEDNDDSEEAKNRVSLMTVHAAKGLEFPTVFIVGLDEGIFPSQRSMDSVKEMEEERRLLYVAITRAEKHCVMTCAKNRYRYGKMEFYIPSSFIKDIDAKYLDVKGGMNGATASYNEIGRGFGSSSDYEINRSYTGSHPWGSDYQRYSSRMQNSNPVASQFRADVKPKITSPHRAEAAIDPFSDGFKQRIARGGGNLRRISDAMTNGGRSVSPTTNAGNFQAETTQMKQGSASLVVGDKIEHQRFGIGVVKKIEGTGENTKATVAFENTGEKQLLLKFARFRKI